MAWSTRELADLAGTTLNTVRHYHRLGLLEEPVRESNGYKRYTVHHLVRLLRIRRLSDLGVPLSQVGEVTGGGNETADALREVDAGLQAQIEHLQGARAAIAAILSGEAPTDSPPGFESVASRLSEADSSLMHISSQLFNAEALADVRRIAEADAAEDSVGDLINALPEDADEASREEAAARLAPELAQNLRDYPWMSDPAQTMSRSPHITRETFAEAVLELYNSAQLDVLRRAHALAQDQLRDDGPLRGE